MTTTSQESDHADGTSEIEELELILDDLRTRYDETPQWEFCDGFLAALVCCRRTIAQAEYFDVLLGIPEHAQEPANEGAEGDPGADAEPVSSFADDAQRARFLQLWNDRWIEVKTALDTEVESLEDDAAYLPVLMDVRGAVAALPEAERTDVNRRDLPAFGQVWALGFMYAVEAWPEEWAPPSDKKLAKLHDVALECIVAMTEDDEGEPEVSPISDELPVSVSLDRLDTYAEAIWSVYDLRAIWRDVGPRVPTLHRANVPGRNDPCSCGSGKKYKKCCGG